MFQQSQKMEMMNYTTVAFDLGFCNITLPPEAVSQPQTQNIKLKIEREDFNSRIELRETMPDEIHYKAV